ncbi:MAG: Glucan 1,3-beta-glucosidase 3 [Thelocarpon impressellum]|nr:MAG: Glucan 1,3-beta-glucosidase 3 [Thelocarpon impressellum]
MFVEGAAGGSELDAVRASIEKDGLEETKQKWAKHWASAVSDMDWSWLVSTAYCTTIRLPIGYFTLGPSFCTDTPFAGPPAEVHAGAWIAVKALVHAAQARGIGVLLDMHALPGGANADAHSGTSSGRADLWNSASARALAESCAVFVARETRTMPGVVGLQIVNEAVYGAERMYAWYDGVLAAVSREHPGLPVYISDAWDLGAALAYSKARNGTCAVGNPVVIDTHKYYTFSDADKAQAPQQIIARIPGELEEVLRNTGNVVDSGASGVIVGEYSCVLDGQTWSRVGEGAREGLVRAFGQAQSQRWQQCSGGSFFWTYRMDWMPGGEWGFVSQTNGGAITAPPALPMRREAVRNALLGAQVERAQRAAIALRAHTDYWNKTTPNDALDHWRFERGWDVGWADATAFFGGRAESSKPLDGADIIGFLDLWVRKRIQESGMGGNNVWEFEHGLRKGVSDFQAVVRN